MPMKRSEAIEKVERLLNKQMDLAKNFTNLLDPGIDLEAFNALFILLSTAKQVEEVVGKLIDEIKHIEKHHKLFTMDDEYYRGARNTYNEILTLLTEEE